MGSSPAKSAGWVNECPSFGFRPARSRRQRCVWRYAQVGASLRCPAPAGNFGLTSPPGCRTIRHRGAATNATLLCPAVGHRQPLDLHELAMQDGRQTVAEQTGIAGRPRAQMPLLPSVLREPSPLCEALPLAFGRHAVRHPRPGPGATRARHAQSCGSKGTPP